MYRIVIICFLFVLSQSLLAQIPNAGFESWTLYAIDEVNITNPTGWASSNNPLSSNVTQSSSAHSGSSAVRGEAVQLPYYVLQPTIQSGVDARGSAYTERPVSITGYYQFFPAASSGDRFGVNVGLFKGGVDGTCIAIAAIANPTETTSYTQFTAVFNYQSEEIPDTCVAEFMIIGPGTGLDAYAHPGSYYLIDDLAFSNVPVSVDEPVNLPAQFSLQQNYPNPFNPSTSIQFSLSNGAQVKLRVFNILGKEVATLVNEWRSAGRYNEKFDASKFSSGVYFYRLDTGNYSAMKQMLLIK
jgi:hypothetical protein